MDQTLLATRVRIPRLSVTQLHRTHLIDILENGIPQYKLTHISAPAGYSKTTLLILWHTRQNTISHGYPLATTYAT